MSGGRIAAGQRDILPAGPLGCRSGSPHLLRLGIQLERGSHAECRPERYRFFGSSLSLDGDTLAIGSMSSAAYVYRHGAGGWEREAFFRAPGSSGDDRFGEEVALQGDVALFAAPRSATATSTGSVWEYRRTGSTWELTDQTVGPPLISTALGTGRTRLRRGDGYRRDDCAHRRVP